MTPDCASSTTRQAQEKRDSWRRGTAPGFVDSRKAGAVPQPRRPRRHPHARPRLSRSHRYVPPQQRAHPRPTRRPRRATQHHTRTGVVETMTHRTIVAKEACPELPIDNDGWTLPGQAAYQSWTSTQSRLGIPSLYYTDRLDVPGPENRTSRRRSSAPQQSIGQSTAPRQPTTPDDNLRSVRAASVGWLHTLQEMQLLLRMTHLSPVCSTASKRLISAPPHF